MSVRMLCGPRACPEFRAKVKGISHVRRRAAVVGLIGPTAAIEDEGPVSPFTGRSPTALLEALGGEERLPENVSTP